MNTSCQKNFHRLTALGEFSVHGTLSPVIGKKKTTKNQVEGEGVATSIGNKNILSYLPPFSSHHRIQTH